MLSSEKSPDSLRSPSFAFRHLTNRPEQKARAWHKGEMHFCLANFQSIRFVESALRELFDMFRMNKMWNTNELEHTHCGQSRLFGPKNLNLSSFDRAHRLSGAQCSVIYSHFICMKPFGAWDRPLLHRYDILLDFSFGADSLIDFCRQINGDAKQLSGLEMNFRV